MRPSCAVTARETSDNRDICRVTCVASNSWPWKLHLLPLERTHRLHSDEVHPVKRQEHAQLAAQGLHREKYLGSSHLEVCALHMGAMNTAGTLSKMCVRAPPTLDALRVINCLSLIHELQTSCKIK